MAAATKPKPAPAKPAPMTTQQYNSLLNAFTVNTAITTHEALKELGIELVAVMVLVLLAGSSPRGAKIATTVLVTLWFVSLILHYSGSPHS
jgi:hypothetical protein